MEYEVCGMFSFMRLLAVLKPLKFSVQLVFFSSSCYSSFNILLSFFVVVFVGFFD